MQIHVTLKGKPTTVSVDDVLFDYFGAWLLDESTKLHSKAKAHHDISKEYIKKLCASPELPSKNVSQFIQQEIIKLIAAPQLENIIKTRGPRYVPPKKPVYGKESDPIKTAEAMAQVAAMFKTPTAK